MNPEERKIIHIDMDAFFASVEQRDHPELRGLPIAVGYDGPRGVVATASYEARRFGVHSALAMATAKRRCPGLIVVEGRYKVYKEVSRAMHDIFHEYTDLVEPISLDEAFLDVTSNKPGMELAVDIAKEIKQKIRQQLHLTASAGVSYNKFLAKIASDQRKPDGLTVIHPMRAQQFIDNLRVEKFWGVGPRTTEQMHHLGIFTGADLRAKSLQYLTQRFGKMGHVLYGFARGQDSRPVVSEWERKSVSCEHTFERDLRDDAELDQRLHHIVDDLVGRLRRSGFQGQTLTLKVKFHDFQQITRSQTFPYVLPPDASQLLPLARRILAEVDYAHHPIRLLGLGVGNPHHDDLPSQTQWIQLEFDFEHPSSMPPDADAPSSPSSPAIG